MSCDPPHIHRGKHDGLRVRSRFRQGTGANDVGSSRQHLIAGVDEALERLRVALGRDPAPATDAAPPDQPERPEADPPVGSDPDERPTDQSSREVRP